jgi:hypothetical protein
MAQRQHYLLFPTAESPRRMTLIGCAVPLSAAMEKLKKTQIDE